MIPNMILIKVELYSQTLLYGQLLTSNTNAHIDSKIGPLYNNFNTVSKEVAKGNSPLY